MGNFFSAKKNKEKNEELFNAVSTGKSHEEIKTLLESGVVDVNYQNKDGDTALIEAAWKSRTDIVKLLLEHKAKIDKRNKNGQTALYLAAKKNHDEIANLLIDSGADTNYGEYFSTTALTEAISHENVSMVRKLLEHGANPRYRNIVGGEPIHSASYCKNKSSEIIQELLKNGAVLEAKQNNGFTPLMQAAYLSNTPALRELLKEAADVNARSAMGVTPLMIAVFEGNLQNVTILLENGADVNQCDSLGCTALHRGASMGCNMDMIQILIQNGSDPTIKNNSNETPLEVARDEVRIGIEAIIQENKMNVLSGANSMLPNNREGKNTSSRQRGEERKLKVGFNRR